MYICIFFVIKMYLKCPYLPKTATLIWIAFKRLNSFCFGSKRYKGYCL